MTIDSKIPDDEAGSGGLGFTISNAELLLQINTKLDEILKLLKEEK